MFRRFGQDERGGIAVIMALVLVPVLGMVGAAIDYSRLASAKSHIQQAVDAASLEAARRAMTAATEGTAIRDQRARGVYDANLSRYFDVATTSFTITDTASQMVVKASGKVALAFGGLLGLGPLPVSAQAAVPLGLADLEVALVLDNTGSMAQYGKMANLKLAAKNLITTIESAKTNGGIGSAKFSIVPFTTQVKAAMSNKNASWLRVGGAPGEPLLQLGWGTWTGCIADRDQPYDVSISAPTGVKDTQYPIAQCQFGTLSQMVPLTSDYAGLRTTIDAMVPAGNTNTTIGMAWGLNTLTNGMPLGDGAAPTGSSRLTRTMIFLTDGTNTQDRWYSNQSQIDARMQALCTASKATGIEIYTIRVLEGNEPLLKGCASDAAHYFSITSASDLDPVFQKIAAQLVRLRISS